jgi:hypothetical protein
MIPDHEAAAGIPGGRSRIGRDRARPSGNGEGRRIAPPAFVMRRSERTDQRE